MAPAPPATVQPLAPARYKVQFTASAELRDKLERLRALMRSSVPDGDLASVIEQAVTEKLERLEARRFARTKAPRKGHSKSEGSPSSRHIPAPRPFGHGGDHSVDNVSLACRGHNHYLAEVDYGQGGMARHRRSSGVSPTLCLQT